MPIFINQDFLDSVDALGAAVKSQARQQDEVLRLREAFNEAEKNASAANAVLLEYDSVTREAAAKFNEMLNAPPAALVQKVRMTGLCRADLSGSIANESRVRAKAQSSPFKFIALGRDCVAFVEAVRDCAASIPQDKRQAVLDAAAKIEADVISLFG